MAYTEAYFLDQNIGENDKCLFIYLSLVTTAQDTLKSIACLTSKYNKTSCHTTASDKLKG